MPSRYSRHRNSVRSDPRQSSLGSILANRRRALLSPGIPLRSPALSSRRSRSSAEGDIAAAKRPPQTHARIKVRHMRSRYRFALSRASHCPEELAAQTVHYLTAKSNAGDIDPAGLFRKWFKDFHTQLAAARLPQQSHEVISSVPSVAFMRAAIRIISNTFFFDGLAKCPFFWEKDLDKNKGALGLCRTSEGVHNWEDIVLDPADIHRTSAEAQTPAEGMLGTLLHECVHLFINIYSCSRRHRRICRQMKCRETMHRMMGDDGHGVAFLQIASHVEALAMRKLGIPLELGIEDAIEIDFEEYEFLLTAREINRCHPDSRQMLTVHGSRAVEVQRRIEELLTGRFRYVAPSTWPALKRAWRKMCFNDRYRGVPVEFIPWEKALRER